MELSRRVQAIKPSPTLAVTARAAALKASGRDIIGLGAGEPDFDTPQHIKDAAIGAINSGFTKYTAVDGTPSLKAAIIAKFKRDNGLDYTPKQILVSCGGKQSFFNLVQAVINPGDEVIIPAPFWVSYPDIVILADGKPVIVEAGIEQGFNMVRHVSRGLSIATDVRGRVRGFMDHYETPAERQLVAEVPTRGSHGSRPSLWPPPRDRRYWPSVSPQIHEYPGRHIYGR